jgi:hypothetical protein
MGVVLINGKSILLEIKSSAASDAFKFYFFIPLALVLNELDLRKNIFSNKKSCNRKKKRIQQALFEN